MSTFIYSHTYIRTHLGALMSTFIYSHKLNNNNNNNNNNIHICIAPYGRNFRGAK